MTYQYASSGEKNNSAPMLIRIPVFNLCMFKT